ncbi:MAG TPA: hypothetical protein VF622_18920 [Segetibacter sp.]|jgi:hypothetical protein
MKKIILSLVLAAFVNVCEAQYNPRPTTSRFFNSKHSTFQVKKGDILVYKVNTGKETFDATLKVTSYGDAISFDYNIPKKKQQGKVTIESNAVNNASDYPIVFESNNPALSTGSVIWLSKNSWRDLASVDKTTTMNLGSGSERFVRQRASTLKIKYKGKDKIVTIYDIANEDTAGKKTLSILTDEQNPLIVRMNNMGYTLTLKEVR